MPAVPRTAQGAPGTYKGVPGAVLVSLHPGEGLTTAPWRSPRRNCGPGPGHQEHGKCTRSLQPQTPTKPSYLKPAQLSEAYSRLKPLPATRTSHRRWVWLPPQPGPLPANLQKEDSLFSPPSEGRQPPQPAFRGKTASSACLKQPGPLPAQPKLQREAILKELPFVSQPVSRYPGGLSATLLCLQHLLVLPHLK